MFPVTHYYKYNFKSHVNYNAFLIVIITSRSQRILCHFKKKYQNLMNNYDNLHLKYCFIKQNMDINI